ncbi:MAG: flavodoxin family protein [Planctomycetia bacterium]
MAASRPADSQALIVCKSVHHQNTAKIARAMADVLGAECVSPNECSYEKLASCKILGLGSGVYYGRVHDELWQWVRDMPEKYTENLSVFIFTTSGLPVLAKLWHWPLKSALMNKGYEVMAEFSCRGFDTWGPLWLTGGLNKTHPDERDIQQARDFAGKLSRALFVGN